MDSTICSDNSNIANGIFCRKAAQRPHLEMLAQLVEKKKRLEREIEKSLGEMARAQNAVSQQVGACVRSRVEALQK